MNPIIKFTTLFGLVAVELAITMSRGAGATLAVIFDGLHAFGRHAMSPSGASTCDLRPWPTRPIQRTCARGW